MQPELVRRSYQRLLRIIMYILLILLILILIYSGYFWNKYQQLKNLSLEAARNIDVHLKERANLLPNLQEVLKGASAHERSTHENIARLRSELQQSKDLKDLQEIAQADHNLLSAFRKLYVLVEDYPDLKVNENFLKFQHDLVEIEDEIESSRRYYNGTIRNLNTFLESFPQVLLNKLFNFKTGKFIEIDFLTRQAPQLDF